MHDGSNISRRTFAKAAALTVVAPSLISKNAAPFEHERASDAAGWEGYDRATVIDFLASPGPFNTPVQVDALTPAMLDNVRKSGITAINLTIGGRTPEAVFSTMAKWERDLVRHPDVLMKVQTVADLATAKRQKKLGLIYGFQDGVAIGNDLSRVSLYAAFGVKIVQLTYNVRNMFGDGCLQPENGGLTPLGRELVDRLNAEGVIVDLGHCGQRTTAEAIAHSKKPVAISHSACRAVADRPRSKLDADLKAMADKGGVVGIYLMPFLTMQGQPNSEDVIKHLEHAVQVCGEDHVGIGSDLSITPHVVDAQYLEIHRQFVEGRLRDGIAAPGEDPAVPMFVSDLNTPRRMERIAEKLAARGHSAARIEKIIGGNFARLIRETWTA